MDISTAYFVKKDDCVAREIAGETLIVPIRSRAGDLNSIYTLNELGTMIWRLIDGQTSISQIIEAVCREYEVTPGEARKDIFSFLTDLKTAGLIQPFGEEREK
jgi:hypothetical protein